MKFYFSLKGISIHLYNDKYGGLTVHELIFNVKNRSYSSNEIKNIPSKHGILLHKSIDINFTKGIGVVEIHRDENDFVRTSSGIGRNPDSPAIFSEKLTCESSVVRSGIFWKSIDHIKIAKSKSPNYPSSREFGDYDQLKKEFIDAVEDRVNALGCQDKENL